MFLIKMIFFRLGIHLVMGFLVESFSDYIGFLSTTLRHQIFAQKILSTILFKIILEDRRFLIETNKKKNVSKFIVNLSDGKVYFVCVIN